MDAVQDPASLQNLNDIVLPAAVGWWPLAPGWWVLLVLAVIFSLWRAWRAWLGHRANRYRREALSELSDLRTEACSAGMTGALLKRTALAVLKRDQVAALSGPAWHAKLDELAGRQLFTGETGQLLDRDSYSIRSHPLTEKETGQLLDATESWLRLHSMAPE